MHRLETNKLRNVAKFFAHLLGQCVHAWRLVFIQFNCTFFMGSLSPFFHSSLFSLSILLSRRNITLTILQAHTFPQLLIPYLTSLPLLHSSTSITGTDGLPWTCLDYIKLNETDTTSSSRIFIKVLSQELSESLGEYIAMMCTNSCEDMIISE